jgi:hypothetical protein
LIGLEGAWRVVVFMSSNLPGRFATIKLFSEAR